MRKYHIAVAGADTLVGEEIIRLLKQREFPISDLKPLAVHAVTHTAFQDTEIAFFAAGVDVTRHYAKAAVKDGALIIDNSDEYRLDSEHPLVVPEVNPEDIKSHTGIIVNPNSSVIPLVMALYPLEKANHIERVNVVTYQAVSDLGNEANDELTTQVKQVLKGERITPHTFTHQIAFNVLPQIDVFYQSGYTKEEIRLISESRKIMHVENIAISATCARVPVFIGHSEAVNLDFSNSMTAEAVTEILRKSPGIRIEDEPGLGMYPQPMLAAGTDDVIVGRIRQEIDNPNGIALWIVADNIRKGAALNMVQIAEETIKRGWLNQK